MTPEAEDYTVAWISALSLEYTIACELLDEQFPAPRRARLDDNCYTFGKIHQHNVVIACLPEGRYGTTAAAVVARDLQSSFPAIRFALMVGIAGGVSRPDLRLGDVVVSSPTDDHGGVLQYDYGKTIQNKDFQRTGCLAPPPQVLLTALSHLKSVHTRQGHKLSQTIDDVIKRNLKLEEDYQRPPPSSDRLYKPTFVHTEGDCDCLLETGAPELCVVRPERQEPGPRVHYGLIACGNQVIRDAIIRDTLVEKYPDLLCFEMESAGLMNTIDCAVIRGICDYSDSHKNKVWQGNAAAVAAAYAKELLSVISMESQVVYSKRANKRTISFNLDQVPVTREFVGRSKELQMIRDVLVNKKERRRIFVLYASGGMGKTQLAIEFMRAYQTEFDAVFWLNGDTEDSLKQSLALQAARLEPKDLSKASISYLDGAEVDVDTVVKDVLHWLARGEITNWLVIYDEVDRDPEDGNVPFAYDIRKYLPKADHGSVLITTRLQRLKRLGDSSYELAKVDQITAKLMLKTWISEDQADDSTPELLERLSGMPLAISQAGAFIDGSLIDVSTYLNLYNRQWEQLAANPLTPLSEYRNRSIWTTWQLSWDAVSQRNQFAANLMILWSYLDCKDLWFGLLNDASQNPSLATDLAIWIGDIATNKITFFKAMGVLRDFSLIEPPENGRGYSMHPVMRRWLFHTKHKNFADAGILALATIGLALEKIHDREVEGHVLPLAQAVCINTLGISVFQQNKERLASLSIQFDTNQKRDYLWIALRNIGAFFYYYDSLDAAALILNLALTESPGNSADDKDTDISIILRDLGVVYYHQDKLSKAEAMIEIACRTTESLYGITDTRTIQAVTFLAWVLGRQGKSQQAIDLYSRMIKALKAVASPTGDESMSIRAGLAIIYLEEGCPDIAEELIMAVRTHRMLLPKVSRNSDRLLRIEGNLSWVYVLQDRLPEAERILINTSKGLLAEFGADHEDSIRARYQLAGVYFLENKIEAAEREFLEIVNWHRQGGTPREHFTLPGKAFGCLGNLYHIQQRWQEARIVFEEALALCENLNEEHFSGLTRDVRLSLEEIQAEQLPGQIDVLAQMRKQPYLTHSATVDGNKAVKLNLGYLRQSYKPAFEVFWRSVRRPTIGREFFSW